MVLLFLYLPLYCYMNSTLFLAFVISLLHGFIPNHWLPIVAISHKQNWSKLTTFRFASLAAWAHSIGTIMIGLIVFYTTSNTLEYITENQTSSALDHHREHDLNPLHQTPFEHIGGIILILLGIWFLYRHYKHHHFHLDVPTKGKKWIFGAILLSMFLSPCMEIIGYFFTLAPGGFKGILALILVYSITTWVSILFGVFLGYKGMKKLDAHKWEHNSGIITSAVMILSGILMWFT